MKFKATLCDPLKPCIIDLGEFSQEKIIQEFEKINWSTYLQKMKNANESEIYYSPSFEIENIENNQGLAMSAVGDPENYEFYIFYKRSKKVKFLFGLKAKLNTNYTTNVTGQSREDVINCLNAMVKNDTIYLTDKMGK